MAVGLLTGSAIDTDSKLCSGSAVHQCSWRAHMSLSALLTSSPALRRFCAGTSAIQKSPQCVQVRSSAARPAAQPRPCPARGLPLSPSMRAIICFACMSPAALIQCVAKCPLVGCLRRANALSDITFGLNCSRCARPLRHSAPSHSPRMLACA